LKKLTHLNELGEAHMVEVGSKAVTAREAVAEGELRMTPSTRRALFQGKLPKGDALAVARTAGFLAAKKTAELIPLCHPIVTTGIDIDIVQVARPSGARVRVSVRVVERTGAEMEALTAVSVTLLTLYDMCKAVQKDMVIERVRLRKKTGGKSGNLRLK
jgi:cyclic pyranopterin phosphate synthase